MARQNAAISPEFTHVRHIKKAGYINGNGEEVRTPFTLVTKLDGDKVHYKVAFCSRNEKNYVKKKGVQVALNSDREFSVPIKEATFNEINDAVLLDLVTNRQDVMPNAHRRWAQILIDKYYEDQAEKEYYARLFEGTLRDLMVTLGLTEEEVASSVH